MLEDVPDLTLAVLNEATQAWGEYEYNRKVHSEIGQAPITRFLAGPEVTRPSPDSDTLRLAFTRTDHRTQRKSDGTLVIEGRRFEIPNRYRHLSRIEVRYAGWDLGFVHLVDERTGKALSRLYPQDKTENASGLRRDRQEVGRGLNNRAENSHQPFRRRERAMQRFRSMKTLQKFSSVHAQVHNHFNHERHLITRQVYKQRRSATLAEWRALAA